jgi:hypothetical protein
MRQQQFRCYGHGNVMRGVEAAWQFQLCMREGFVNPMLRSVTLRRRSVAQRDRRDQLS